MVRKLPPLPTFPSVFGAEIRLIRRGCSNRRFFQIGVATAARRPELAANEVIGAYDPMVNENGEKLVSLDLHRFAFWLGQGAKVTAPLRDLLGLCGVLPITPETYVSAWKKRQSTGTEKENLSEHGKEE